jgi:AAA15 family ATPase/GTPase
MKIKVIEINNYKAFYGKQKINVGGKNLFIYGENGSGKSSLYYALKDFFQSSIEDIDLTELENIFITDTKKGSSYIKVTFNPDSEGKNRSQHFQLTTTTKDTGSDADTSIRDANKLKSFLTYKHLLEIHHIQKGRQIDLFNLLVNGVLKHFRYTLTNGKELGELWQTVETHIAKTTNISYNLARKRKMSMRRSKPSMKPLASYSKQIALNTFLNTRIRHSTSSITILRSSLLTGRQNRIATIKSLKIIMST